MAHPMTDTGIQLLGAIAATLTTLCWLPQALKIIRSHDTAALSLPTTVLFTLGVGCWLGYGVLRGDVPVIAANAATLVLNVVILRLKLKYG
jgi:MtN3 and saliva related transmembrane protein